MKIKPQIVKNEVLNSVKVLNEKASKAKLEHFQSLYFNSKEFRDKESAKRALKKIEKSKFPLIYIVSINNSSLREKIIKKFIDFKSENDSKTRGVNRTNLSRFNKENISSETLYVGSSTTDFKTRIKNHFGIMGIRVYSLHLSKCEAFPLFGQ